MHQVSHTNMEIVQFKIMVIKMIMTVKDDNDEDELELVCKQEDTNLLSVLIILEMGT